ncbi:CPBP family intramembrane glutamic endopeptidase [Micromonospora sp. NPDC050686]|uniref:CPBP family intramembrane glutamic endopeptidase n=1 Tax=Micromonospora sp. NPDC050686 TaxID=3154631 RepID=UPI0033C70CA3
MTTTQLRRPHRPGPAGRLFLGPDRRLRRWWRVLAYLAAVLALAAPLGGWGQRSLTANLIAHAGVLLGVLGLTYVFRRHVDRRRWRDIGLTGRPGRNLWVGFLTGVLAMVAYLAVLWGAGWARFTGTELADRGVPGAVGLLGAGLFFFATSAVVQEVAFRGYVLQTLADGWSLRGAAVSSSVIFALLHFSGVPTPLFALILLADLGLMAGFLVLTRLSTGALWLAIGFHTAWNWTMDTVFSLDTDVGADYGDALVHVRLHAPAAGLGPQGAAELLYLLTSALLFTGYWLVTSRRRAVVPG